MSVPDRDQPLLGPVVEAAFRGASRWRGARAFHPRGSVLTGRLVLDEAGAFLADRRTTDVVVRVSRGLGVRQPLPDFNGVAVRIPDAHGAGAHQDVLLVSSGAPPLLRHGLRPVRRWDGVTFTSVLPFETDRGVRMIGATLHPRTRPSDGRGPGPLELADLVGLARAGALDLRLLRATPLGPWEPIGTAHLTGVLDARADDPSFDPWNTGDGLRPWGWANRLRRPAYHGSRAGRAAPDRDGADPGTPPRRASAARHPEG